MFKHIKPFIVMDILKKASAFEDAIHLEIGEPDLPPSRSVLNHLQKAISNGSFGYTEAKGLKSLREAISTYYKNFYNIE
ncbi:MAG TPA: pyridoxal phosphate-dependent aminotransferase, partial [Hydrogenobaculum sp.]|nr:pyridoxal phosphate-dependent aminotransferase [Hydrogenobaculum sp.]